MLVKYRTLPSITAQNFLDDIVGILDGSITSTAGLSAGADTTNSAFSGTYPTSQLTKVAAGTYTFSKIHSVDTNYTHYFRLAFSGATVTTFTVAQGYTSGTDTLLNSVAHTVNVSPSAYQSHDQFPAAINIVMNSKCVYFSSLTSGIGFGLFDIGANGITNTYTSNMLMAFVKPTTGTFNIPYAYVLNGGLSGYTSLTGSITNLELPRLVSNANDQGVIVENPVFLSHASQGHQSCGVYGLFKLGRGVIASDVYYNTSGVTRLTSFDYAVPADG